MATTEEVVQSLGCCKSELQLPLDSAGQSAVGSRAILATITPKEYPVFTSIQEHSVLICNVRYDSEQASPLWKQYRWNEWAFSRGIITDIPYKPVRNVQIFNPLVGFRRPNLGDIGIPLNDELWLDFEDFSQQIRTFEVFYKPSYFKYSLRAWSEQELLLPPQVAEDVVIKHHKASSTKEKGGGDAKSVKSAKTAKPEKKASAPSSKAPSSKGGKGKKKAEDNSMLKEEWPKNLKKSSFFYLYMDSLARKDILCSVSVYSPDRPPYAIIFVGRFEWHSPSVAPITNRMSTTATGARFFILPPGLRLYRIWYQFPTYFCMQFFSNTPFQTGSKMFIQQCLTTDSVSYKFYGKEISTSFEQLLVAPQGGAGHGGAFQQLMRSLQPPQNPSLPWPGGFTVYTELTQAFEESLTEMLVETIHQPEEVYQTIQAFQLLFLNPAFGLKTLEAIRPDLYEYIMEQKELQKHKTLQHEQELKEQLAQALEQKGKKGGKTSKKSVESPKTGDTSKPAKSEKAGSKKEKKDSKSKPKAITEGEQLKKLISCKEKNLMLNDQSQAILLLKKMMSKVPHLRHLYPFYQEDDIKLVIKDYLGERNTPDSWVVLVRGVFNIHSTEPVPCSVHVWSPVENLVLRLMDNDSGEEIPFGFVENNVSYLKRNKSGYTVVAYGETDAARAVPWRLRSMGLREEDCLHVCAADADMCTALHTDPPQQTQQTLHGYYLPNKQNVIANCLLEVTADVTVLLRVSLSYKSAIVRLTVTDEAGDIVCDISGMGRVTVTMLNLKGAEDRFSEVFGEDTTTSSESGTVKPNTQVYRVTATLLDHSWPLSPTQIKAMLYYKENLPDILLRHNAQIERRSFERLHSLTKGHSKERKRSSSLQRSSLKSQEPLEPQDPEDLFESISDKPSWSITLVTNVQEEMPVKLRLDTSLYDEINELKTEWENQGFELSGCKTLRQEFLAQYEEDMEEDFSEETVFKLKPKRLEQLIELYGKKIDDNLQQEGFPSSGSVMSYQRSAAHSTVVHSTVTSGRTLYRSDRSEFEPRQTSSGARSAVAASGSDRSRSTILRPSTAQTPPNSEESLSQVHVSNVLVQQAGVHKALQNIREKTLDHIQQIFKETAELREKIINEMKMAKEAETGNDKSKDKKGKKSKDDGDKKGKKSKDTSPTGTKGKKGSVTIKGGKGKGK